MGDQQHPGSRQGEPPNRCDTPLCMVCCSTKRHASITAAFVARWERPPALVRPRFKVRGGSRVAGSAVPPRRRAQGLLAAGLRYAEAAATTAGRISESGIGVRGSLWMGAEPK